MGAATLDVCCASFAHITVSSKVRNKDGDQENMSWPSFLDHVMLAIYGKS